MSTSLSGGTATSFSNTPQAGDDLFTNTGLTEDSLNTVFLDVMGNDLGGNAKMLWSLDNGISASTSTKTYAPADLLVKDTGGLADSTPDFSFNGVRVWITSDGKVGYNASSLSMGFKAQLQSLAVGESLIDSFTYAIRLGNGTLSWATAQVQFSGTNDAPVISGTVNNAADLVQEDSDLSATGTLTSADIDNGATAIWTIKGNASGSYGSLALTGNSGVWTYNLANGTNGVAGAVQSLAAGETVTDTFTVRVTDDQGAFDDQTVTITITGTNDAASITGTATGTAQEDVMLTATGSLTVSDIDTGEAEVVPQTNSAGIYGSFTITAAGAWTYTLANGTNGVASAVQSLTAGQIVTDSFTVASEDGSDTETVTITITGTNDAPNIQVVITDSATSTLLETNAGLTSTGTLTVTDVDLTNTVSSSVTTVFTSGITSGIGLTNGQLLAMFSVTPNTGLAADTGNTHNLTWNLNSGTQAFDYLAAGQSLTLTYTVQSTDNNAASDTQTVTVTINGTDDNHAPVAKNDVWVLSDSTSVPAGAISVSWFINNDTDADGNSLFVTAVTGLTGTGLNANFDGLNHLIDITGTTNSGIGSINLGYTLSDGITTSNASVSITVLDTTSAANTFTLEGNDFSYIDGIGGGDRLTGDLTLSGNAGIDNFIGSAGDDILKGGAGDDILSGGANNDTLNGGIGRDVIAGGNNNDKFDFSTISDSITVLSLADVITDFKQNGTDLIDLSAIDANTIAAGDQAFTFVTAANANTVANRITWFESVGNTIIQIDNTGNTTADMNIILNGVGLILTATDFIL